MPKAAERTMGRAEYEAVQSQILMLAALVREINVEDFLRCISLSEATGPILDPTLFLCASKNLEEIKKIALGVQAFKKSLPQPPKGSSTR